MPEDLQVTFAGSVVRDGLSKTNVGRLVSLYTREETDGAIREAILDRPLAVLDTCPAGPVVRRKEKRGLAERIAGNIGFLTRLACELKELLVNADAQNLTMVNSHLDELRMTLAGLRTFLDGIAVSVSPGKPQGGGAS